MPHVPCLDTATTGSPPPAAGRIISSPGSQTPHSAVAYGGSPLGEPGANPSAIGGSDAAQSQPSRPSRHTAHTAATEPRRGPTPGEHLEPREPTIAALNHQLHPPSGISSGHADRTAVGTRTGHAIREDSLHELKAAAFGRRGAGPGQRSSSSEWRRRATRSRVAPGTGARQGDRFATGFARS